jgi:signal transduction histidine kinase
MWATRSRLREHALELVVAAVVLVDVALMAVFPRFATVPFHIIWIAVVALFGVREWGVTRADAFAVGLGLLTAGVLGWDAVHDGIDAEEISEVPLMAVVFLVMVLFLRRKQARLEHALAELRSQHEGRRQERAAARRTGHDLRSPLSVARGHAELIRMRATDPTIREDSDAVIEAVDRVADITLRLRDLDGAERPSDARA